MQRNKLKRQESVDNNNDMLNLTRRSFRRRKFLSQISAPGGFPEDAPMITPGSFTGHELFSVSYNNYIKKAIQPPSPAASILGRVFSFSNTDMQFSNSASRIERKHSKCVKKRRKSSLRNRRSDSNENQEDDVPNLTPIKAILSPNIIQKSPSLLTVTETCSTSAEHTRLRALITIDPRSTEILIANNNLRRMFGLDSEPLIGKKYTEVFDVKRQKEYHQHRKGSFCVGVTVRPVVAYEDLFDDGGDLKVVHGKAVDVLDSQGQITTVCLWSYPLTTVDRDNKPIITRSPSTYIPKRSIPRQHTGSHNSR
ncbi:unnamed protein product [Bursaphelenchus okinawaensis]|uniref:PAS fold domain-containing protein n=1 Tax=Bursaphelenchus okinawaensis TaxID=465554 RepID=A0A811LKI3_9BILA|nr:unnamed protein product [Bursaphelenchus okinawaensis]CAG9124752.1 unnamed protein product [Bursaphelenchus okinawaensis]